MGAALVPKVPPTFDRYGQPMARIALALALLGVLLWPTAARADGFAGERPAGPRAQMLAGMAVEFWGARNVHACPSGVALLQAPLLEAADGDAMGRGANCVAWITTESAAELEARRPYAAGLRVGCMVIFHEVGHALGLPHTESGVMGAVPSFPWECVRWTNQEMRPEDARLRLQYLMRAARASHRAKVKAVRSNAVRRGRLR